MDAYKIRRLGKEEFPRFIEFHCYFSGLRLLEEKIKDNGITKAFSEDITITMFNKPFNIDPQMELRVALSRGKAFNRVFIQESREFEDVIPFVAEYNGKIVGVVHLISPKINSDIAIYGDLHIHPVHRQHGLGSRLTEACINYLEKKGAKAVFLTTGEGNPAYKGIYLKFGFIDLVPSKGGWMGKFFDIDNPKKFLEDYYNIGSNNLLISNLSLGHYPGIQMLMNNDTTTLIKNYFLGIFKENILPMGLIVRGLLDRDLDSVLSKTIIVENKVIGFVSLSPWYNKTGGLFRGAESPFASQERHVRLLDIYLSPYHWREKVVANFLDDLKNVCQAQGIEKLHLYVDRLDIGKQGLLKKFGFTVEGVLKSALKIGSKAYDIPLMAKTFS